MKTINRQQPQPRLRQRRQRNQRIDRGVVSVEMAGFVIPTMVMVMVILYCAFNLVTASIDLTTAAASAARAASLQRSAAAASAAAQTAAADDLAAHTVTCAQLTVVTDTSRWEPGGAVTVTVTCLVRLRTLSGVSFLPGALNSRASSTAPLDSYRTVAADTIAPARIGDSA